MTITRTDETGRCIHCGKQTALGRNKDCTNTCNNGHEICFSCWEKTGHNCPVCLSARTPKPPAPQPAFTGTLNKLAHLGMCRLRDLCLSLGMIPSKNKSMEDDMEDFVRSLAGKAKQPAPKAFTMGEIERWLSRFTMTNQIQFVQSKLNDPQDGINAVAGKGGEG